MSLTGSNNLSSEFINVEVGGELQNEGLSKTIFATPLSPDSAQRMVHAKKHIYDEEDSYHTISEFYVEAGPLSGVYSGGLKNGKYHGHGLMKYSRAPRIGQIYEGNWVDDLKCGQGRMIYANGDVYTGEWSNDMRNGNGKLKSQSGASYEGEWKDDVREGQGTIVNCDGSRYVGEFHADKRHGTGVLYRKDGSPWYSAERNQWRSGSIV